MQVQQNLLTMDRRILPLESHLSSFVRASKSIGSFHAAVEEVILNSIDAGCQTVDIYIDLATYSFEIYDDGKSTLYDLYIKWCAL